MAVDVDSPNKGLHNVSQDLGGRHLCVAKGCLTCPHQGCRLGIVICLHLPRLALHVFTPNVSERVCCSYARLRLMHFNHENDIMVGM